MAKSPASKNDSTRIRAQVRTYLAALPPNARKILKNIRESIRDAAPDAVEHFSYGIPGFRLNGEPLLWYAAWKNHVSLYPITASIKSSLAGELEGYEVSKGTVRFPLTEPPPVGLVKRLAKARIADIRKKKRR